MKATTYVAVAVAVAGLGAAAFVFLRSRKSTASAPRVPQDGSGIGGTATRPTGAPGSKDALIASGFDLGAAILQTWNARGARAAA